MLKKTFAAALATGNHLVAQLKKNQRTLFEAGCAIAASNDPQDTAFTRDLARNRQEDRTVDVFTVGDALARTDWQPFIKTIIRVSRRTLIFNTATGRWKPRSEIAWYVSSASGLSASDWQKVIRGHWGIETETTMSAMSPAVKTKAASEAIPASWHEREAARSISCATTASRTSPRPFGPGLSTSMSCSITADCD
jgi:hypothetical protein